MYVILKCSNCQNFNVWYKNKENRKIEEFCVMKGNKIIKKPDMNAEVNLVWYKSVSFYHSKNYHKDILF